jgi:non-ribosomal peptide synthase protein (TIGR01720 family)
MSFNYLGGLMTSPVDGAGPFVAVAEEFGASSHPDNRRPHLIDVLVMMVGDRLEIVVWYSAAHYLPATIAAFGKEIESALHALIGHCEDPDHHGVTRSDFPLAALSQHSLDRIINNLDN